MNDRYCQWCRRQFTSHEGLRMHWQTSKYHNKEKYPQYYHKDPKVIEEIERKAKIDKEFEKNKKIDQYIKDQQPISSQQIEP